MKKPISSAREACVTLLARRNFSAQALFEKLCARGYDEDEAEDAVSYFVDLGYVDDAQFAAALSAAQAAKGYGARRVEQFLRAHGVSASMALEAAEIACADSAGRIDALLRAKCRASLDATERARLGGMLFRRGFDAADIQAGLNRLISEDTE